MNKSIITRDTLIPIGLVGGLLALSAFIGAQNQKLNTTADDVKSMKISLNTISTDVANTQKDIALIKDKLSPQRGISDATK